MIDKKNLFICSKGINLFPRGIHINLFFHLIIISKGLYNPIHIVLTQQRNWNSWFIPYELYAFDAKMTAYIKYFSINNDILVANFTLSYKILKCRFFAKQIASIYNIFSNCVLVQRNNNLRYASLLVKYISRK